MRKIDYIISDSAHCTNMVLIVQEVVKLDVVECREVEVTTTMERMLLLFGA